MDATAHAMSLSCFSLLKQCFEWMQTVKARVLSSNPVAKRMRLSLKPKSAADVANGAVAIHGEDPLGGLQPGDFVEGSVRSITTKEVHV